MYKHILIPTDFSETSRRAMDQGLDLASKFGARVTFLHASAHIDHGSFMDPTVLQSVNSLLDSEGKKLEAVAREEIERHVRSKGGDIPRDRIRIIVSHGNPAEVVVQAAQDEMCDLIVMGTHGRQGFRDRLIGSTTERVMRQSLCDVLAVKPEGWPIASD